MSINTNSTQPPSSSIVHVTDKNFAEVVLQNKKKVVVDFYADWCGPCRAMEPIFEAAAQEMPDVQFVKLDVDAYSDIAGTYNVFSIPTLIIFKDGKPVVSRVGVMEKNRLIEEIKNA